MCGICCIYSTNNSSLQETYGILKEYLNRRGPNSNNCIEFTSNSINFLFAASVLWLQGDQLQAQPINTPNSLFLYNGDIFEGINSSSAKGDTLPLFQQLEASKDIATTLNTLQGPYSYIFYKKDTHQLHFARDIYGRRSLLIGRNERTQTTVLTSVAVKSIGFKSVELPAIGNFRINLQTQEMFLTPWTVKDDNFYNKLKELEELLDAKIIINDIVDNRVYTFNEPTHQDLHILKTIETLEPSKIFDYLLNDNHWRSKVQQLNGLLETAVSKRIGTQPQFCQNCIKTRSKCVHTLTGVLFSGGLDCAVLALLADKFTDIDRSIDLMNVSFDEKNNYGSPDRLTGMETLAALRKLCPNRNWNFIHINVPQRELDLERKRRICNVIYPLNSILDDSLGCALWFAARGENAEYKSPCRVVLVGMGADELFGGYTKHKAALKRNSWLGLYNSLELDWNNIPYRNLGRDDRTVSDHGRQLRTPYLDENVVDFLRQLNCWERTYPLNLPQGIGEKILLRSLAHHLGFRNTACFKKRALQFGSRIANKKENACDISPRL